MLQELYLENYVLFEQASLYFKSGVNAISGETGAGKSLLAKALSLALGERASAEVIRAEAPKAVVSATFELSPELIKEFFASLEMEAPDGNQLIFERTIRREGSSRMTINGRPASATAVRGLALRIMDISAQNEHTRLAEPEYQRELLDLYGNAQKAAEAFAGNFQRAVSLKRRLEAGDAEKAKVRSRLEEIRATLELIEQAAWNPKEDPLLESRIEALSHSEAIHGVAGSGIEMLYESEDSIQDRIAILAKEANRLADCSPSLKDAAEALSSVEASIEEAVRSFRDAADAAEGSPDELDAAIERSEALKKLARKLGCELSEIPDREAALRKNEEELSAWGNDASEIKKQLAEALEKAVESGLKLRLLRKAAAAKLSQAVALELNDLDMPQAAFHVDINPLWEETDPPEKFLSATSSGGLEEIVFGISPNPGEAVSTLADNASGGEASRAMLAIKAALSEAHCPPVLFFDEIDTGIGGRLGDTVSDKLRELSGSRQIITITHLPQIAAKADLHCKVSKTVSGKRTVASARQLEGEDRVEEIAAMIRGKASTATTVKQAREMLKCD